MSRQRRSLAGSKKVNDLELRETLLEQPANAVLELDELWSFVCRKSEKVWVWLALCRESRQVVAFVMGDAAGQPANVYGKRFPEAISGQPATQ